MCSIKGGVGKTTLSFNLAAMCALAGRRVLLVDADRQEQAARWAALRERNGQLVPFPCLRRNGRIGAEIVRLSAEFDVVVVDAAGHDNDAMREAMAVADRTIIPLQPQTLPAWGLANMHRLIVEAEEKGAKIRAASVLSIADPRRTSVATRVCEAIDSAGIPRLTTTIHNRAATGDSVATGRCVADLKPSRTTDKARAEFISLYQEIFHEEFAVATV